MNLEQIKTRRRAVGKNVKEVLITIDEIDWLINEIEILSKPTLTHIRHIENRIEEIAVELIAAGQKLRRT